MFTVFNNYINENEEWLMGRVLDYAQKRNYTKYTSTLKEAWRLSITGLSKSLIESVKAKNGELELSPDEDYTQDTAAQFGIIEAKRHRERGVSLDMFLGLMKYYRETYLDLIKESNFDESTKLQYINWVKRFFDRVEIGFCVTWASSEQDQFVGELQNCNRQMTNEKNKYLTIFESLFIPVFIVDRDKKIENLNHAAFKMLVSGANPGAKYYEELRNDLIFTKEFPWLADLFEEFIKSNQPKSFHEITLGDEDKSYQILLSTSLDISGKFSGAIVIVEDITPRKKIEKELEKLATTDPLTGAKNRRAFLQFFEQELTRSQRYGYKFALMMLDIDNFKHINDTYGHDTGDKVLKLLVAESLGTLRGADLFGRWGGEEFIILLPDTEPEHALLVAERLRSNLTKIEICADSGNLFSFTASIGITIVEDKNSGIDDIIKKADQALYKAKEQGRNRVALM